jgi:hypothetical protein
MKNFIWRVEKLENRILAAPLTEFKHRLHARFEVLRRGAVTRGENVPREAGPRRGNAVASRASARRQPQLAISGLSILHRRWERAWLEDPPSPPWQSSGRGDILSQDCLPVGGAR